MVSFFIKANNATDKVDTHQSALSTAVFADLGLELQSTADLILCAFVFYKPATEHLFHIWIII